MSSADLSSTDDFRDINGTIIASGVIIQRKFYDVDGCEIGERRCFFYFRTNFCMFMNKL